MSDNKKLIINSDENEIIDVENIYMDIKSKILTARSKMLKHIDTTMTEVYWYVGKITYELSENSTKASYGKKVIDALSVKLTNEFGSGFSPVSIRRMRRFYEFYPIWSTVSTELSWAHFQELIRIDRKEERDFYEKESIDDDFENLNSLFEICKIKSGNALYMQFSLRAIREFIEQPIGSPKLNYKEMSLDKKLAESNFRQSVLLTAGIANNKIVFVPLLDEASMDKYILRLKEYILSVLSELHEDAAKTLRIVYFQTNEKLNSLENELCTDYNGNLTAIAKLKKLVFEDYNSYQFNFGGQIADFIDSLSKIVIAAGSCGELGSVNEDKTIDVNTAISIIKNSMKFVASEEKSRLKQLISKL